MAGSREKLFGTLEMSAAQLFPFIFTKQSNLRSSWPSSVWKLAFPVCGRLLLVEWACKMTQYFHHPGFSCGCFACLFL